MYGEEKHNCDAAGSRSVHGRKRILWENGLTWCWGGRKEKKQKMNECA